MFNNPNDLYQYFDQIKKHHPKLKTFVKGDSEAIVSSLLENAQYPLLWMESPEPDITLNEKTNYKVYCTVLLKTVDHTPNDIIYCQNESYAIAGDIISKVLTDAEDGKFEIKEDISIDAVSPVTSNNEYGYRFIISIDVHRQKCTTCNFADFGNVNLVSFGWKNEATTAHHFNTTLTPIIDATDENYTILWTYTIDQGTEMTSTDPILNIDSPGDLLSVKLKVTSNTGDDIFAYALYCSKHKMCGLSYPFSLKNINTTC